jgi:hypothetical protein
MSDQTNEPRQPLVILGAKAIDECLFGGRVGQKKTMYLLDSGFIEGAFKLGRQWGLHPETAKKAIEARATRGEAK